MEDPVVPPAKLEGPISRMPPGWNGYNVEWKLPDYGYSKEWREEQLKNYQKCLKFEEENNFQEQSNMFLSDYRDLLEMKKELEKRKKEEKKVEVEVKKEELIELTRPVDFEDLNYVMDNYDYDPYDDVVNRYNDTQAENFIRSKVVEFRKSIGKQI